MSLSVHYKGQKYQFKMQCSLRRFIGYIAIVALLLLAMFKPWQETGLNLALAKARIAQEQDKITNQIEAVQALRLETKQELSAILAKVGDLQGQIMRLEASQLRQTEQVDSFDDQVLAIGGPEVSHYDFPPLSSHHLLSELDNMILQLENKQKQLTALESALVSRHIEEERYIIGRPLATGWLSSPYGVRKDPFTNVPTMHKGIDYAADIGTPVQATGAGIVAFSGTRSGFGRMIEIDHGAGIRTRYAHLQTLDVQVGDLVTRGVKIGEVGQTGRSTGPHVHYEVLHRGKQVDPTEFVLRVETALP